MPYSAAFYLAPLLKVFRTACNTRGLIGGQQHAVDRETGARLVLPV
ncbi:MAG: hypothetical protein ACLQOO_09975 [Terriglobia bacterium]